MDKEKLAQELIENLEKANADPAAADEKELERTGKVEPVTLDEDDAE